MTEHVSTRRPCELLRTLREASWNGVASREQLTASGMTPKAIEWQVRRGALLPIARGVHAVGRPVSSERATLAAALLASGPGAILAGRSAASVWQILPWESTVEVVRSAKRRPPSFRLNPPGIERPRWVSVRRSAFLGPEDVTGAFGFPVTTVPRTLLDLAGQVDRELLETALDEAARRRLLPEGDLARFRGRGSGWRGIGEYRAVVSSRTPGMEKTESRLEGMFLRAWATAGLPMPEPNRKVLRFRVDLLWRDAGLIVELDGYGTHRSRAAFERDRDRDNELKRAGYQVLRFTYRMVRDRPEDVVALVADQLRHRTVSCD